MAKYLIQAAYTPEGLKGLAKETASGRKAAVQAAMKAIKGKVECMYFTFGDDDVILVVDAPDNVSIAALSVLVSSSGLVRIRTTPLLTVDEMDSALAMPLKYRSPGSEK